MEKLDVEIDVWSNIVIHVPTWSDVDLLMPTPGTRVMVGEGGDFVWYKMWNPVANEYQIVRG